MLADENRRSPRVSHEITRGSFCMKPETAILIAVLLLFAVPAQAKCDISINGRHYSFEDCNGRIVTNKQGTYMNGVLIESYKSDERTINVTIDGNVGQIDHSAGDLTVNGNVTGNIKSNAGNVEIKGDVGGDVTSSAGNVTASIIKGRASVTAGNISGATQ
jgi:hypothetical protein